MAFGQGLNTDSTESETNAQSSTPTQYQTLMICTAVVAGRRGMTAACYGTATSTAPASTWSTTVQEGWLLHHRVGGVRLGGTLAGWCLRQGKDLRVATTSTTWGHPDVRLTTAGTLSRNRGASSASIPPECRGISSSTTGSTVSSRIHRCGISCIHDRLLDPVSTTSLVPDHVLVSWRHRWASVTTTPWWEGHWGCRCPLCATWFVAWRHRCPWFAWSIYYDFALVCLITSIASTGLSKHSLKNSTV